MDAPNRQRWIDLLLAERGRRLTARLGFAGDPREWLLARLDEMAGRLQSVPDFAPPPEAASAELERELLNLLGR